MQILKKTSQLLIISIIIAGVLLTPSGKIIRSPAPTEPTQLYAESLTFQLTNGSVLKANTATFYETEVLLTNIEVTQYPNRVLHANQAIWPKNQSIIYLTGNVIATDKTQGLLFKGPSAQFNIESQTIEIDSHTEINQ